MLAQKFISLLEKLIFSSKISLGLENDFWFEKIFCFKPLITKLKAYRSRGTDKFLFLAHLQKETIKSETLPRINWSTAWLNFDQPIFIDLTAENLDRSKNFSINGIDYVIKIEKSQKEKNKVESEDLWKDPSPRKETTEKPKNLNFEKFLSIHIHEKHDPDQNLNLQSLVRKVFKILFLNFRVFSKDIEV